MQPCSLAPRNALAHNRAQPCRDSFPDFFREGSEMDMITGHAFMATSLDGFIARRDHGLDWLAKQNVANEDHGFDAFMDSVDGLITGRGSFNNLLGFDEWPYKKPVIVMSNSLTDEDVPAELRKKVRLTQLGPKQLMDSLHLAGWNRAYVDGGQVVQSFLRAGLISDLTLTLVPILLGDGRRLFGETDRDIDLELQEAKSFPSGLVQLRYEITQS